VKTIIKKPHLFFFSVVPIFIIIGFIKATDIIDVTIYNTFFAVKVNYWCYFSAAFLSLIGLNYFMIHWLKKPLVDILSLFHILFQFAALISFLFCILFINAKRGSGFIPAKIDLYSVLSISFILFLVSFFMHILNFFISLLSKKEKYS
jgi:hypothetical protein